MLNGDAKTPVEVKQCEYVFSGFYEIGKLQILDNIVCNHPFQYRRQNTLYKYRKLEHD